MQASGIIEIQIGISGCPDGRKIIAQLEGQQNRVLEETQGEIERLTGK